MASYLENKITEVMNRNREEENEDEKGKNELLPYIEGMSEKITRMCTFFNIKAFKARPTLRNLLVKVKGKPLSTSRLGFVYCISVARCISGKQEDLSVSEFLNTNKLCNN